VGDRYNICEFEIKTILQDKLGIFEALVFDIVCKNMFAVKRSFVILTTQGICAINGICKYSVMGKS